MRCGALHSLVLTSAGEVYSFGWGASGALGHGGIAYELEARRIDELALKHVHGIAAGGRHSIALEGGGDGPGTAGLQRDMGALLRSGLEADIVIDAGRPPAGHRRFLAHCAVLSSRCPRLVSMLAFQRRFVRRTAGHVEGSKWHVPLQWPSQAAANTDFGESDAAGRASTAAAIESALAASGSVVPLRLPAVRAPIFALLLTWCYTGVIETTEPVFLSQLGAAARMLGLAPLVAQCDLAQSCVVTSAGESSNAAATAANSPSAQLAADLSKLVDEGLWNDVTLTTTDGELQACRALLCIRCDYFMHLLHGQFKESGTNLHDDGHPSPAIASIDLRPFDIDREHGEHLLRYMCSGAPQAKLEPNVALALLPHASALLMDDLKRLCEATLVLVVDADNAAALQEVAERCYATRLRYMCEGVLNSPLIQEGKRESDH